MRSVENIRDCQADVAGILPVGIQEVPACLLLARFASEYRYNGNMISRTDRAEGHSFLLPSVVFALAFVLLGWIASHSVAYAIVGLLPHGHDHYEQHIHDYLGALKLAGGCVLVFAFTLALRVFFKHGTFGDWLHEGGIAGTRKQITLATILPATVFVATEYLERFAAGPGTNPSARLLVVGVFVQLAVGLLCLGLVRMTFRVAEKIIEFAVRSMRRLRDRRTTSPLLESVVFARLLCPLADSKAGRAPPILVVSY